MKSLALAVLVVACNGDAYGDAHHPSPPASPSPATPTADEGLARAAVASLPASEWPCGVQERSREGGKQWVYEFEYTRTSCVVPVTALHLTLGGCPDRVRGGRVTYDAQGRLVEHGDTKYTWGKHGPIAVGRWRFVALGDDVATRDGTVVDEIVRLDARGRVTSVDQVRDVLKPPSSTPSVLYSFRLEYDGRRIARTQYAATGATPAAPTQVVYTCVKK